MRHWWHRLFHRGLHERFCTCRVVAYVYVGRSSVSPGELIHPSDMEVISGGR